MIDDDQGDLLMGSERTALAKRLPRRQLLRLFSFAGVGSLLTSACDDRGGGADRVDAAPAGPANPDNCKVTTPDVEGPYYVSGAPSRAKIAADSEPGERLLISGRVLDADCETPLAEVVVDVWQADQTGSYHGADQQYRLRGVLRTDGEGRYQFETIVPGRYALGTGFRPAHIHFMLSHPAYKSLTTQLYFFGDPHLPPNDPCGSGCNSDEEERIIALSEGAPRRGTFDIVLLPLA